MSIWVIDYDAADLTQSDIVLLNSSAGKDSQAQTDVIATRAALQGVVDRLVVVHCDLGRVEWKGTKELAQEQAEAYGLRFEVVARDQDLLDQIESRGRFPGAGLARYCTSDNKTAQVAKLLTRLVTEWRARTGLTRPCRILNCLGIRSAEGGEHGRRAKEIRTFTPDGQGGAYSVDKRASTKTTRHVVRYYPIADWSDAKVWECIKASGVRYHEAYKLGMSRLSCCFCIFATRKDLVIAGNANRELLDAYCKVEEKIGHQFTARLSIRDIRDEVAA